MIKKIFQTAGARFFSALITFLVMIISINAFGSEGYGVIGMITLNIMLIGMFNDFVGGGALVYLVPRHSLTELLIISYLWSVFTAVTGAILVHFFDDVSGQYAVHIFFIALLHNFFAVNTKVFLGQERIRLFNVLLVIQLLLLAAALSVFVFLMDASDIQFYVRALYLSYGFSLFISLFFLAGKTGKFRLKVSRDLIKQSVRLGFFSQVANIAQFLNYRLTYYMIQKFWVENGSTSVLGVYNATNKFVEGSWLVSKSLSLVQYSVLANRDDEQYALRLTLAFFKLSFLITFLITLVLVLLSPDFYQWLLQEEKFGKIPGIILAMSPGILVISINNIISHYFAGKGLQWINARGSLTGLAVTLIAGLILVPEYGIWGAAYTTSLAHIASFTYMFFTFLKKTYTGITDFMPGRSDIKLVKKMLTDYLNN